MQGYEAEYIFGAPFNQAFTDKFYNFTNEEKRLSEEMMRFWTNFASTGSPNLNPGEFHTRNKELYWDRYETYSPQSVAILNAGTSLTSNSVSAVAAPEGTSSSETSSLNSRIDDSRKHMVFALPRSYMSRNLRRHHCMFWREQLPVMRERILYNTACRSSQHTGQQRMDNVKNSQETVGTLYPNIMRPFSQKNQSTTSQASSNLRQINIRLYLVLSGLSVFYSSILLLL
ncbi:unnamed protein product [Trichobilharzia regenti]|nr:unnamed protein product [Trichobilharzia regenti]